MSRSVQRKLLLYQSVHCSGSHDLHQMLLLSGFISCCAWKVILLIQAVLQCGYFPHIKLLAD